MPPDPHVPFTFNDDGTFNLCDEGLYGIAGKLYATFDSFAIDVAPTPPTIAHKLVAPRMYAVDPFTGATTVLAKTDWNLSAIVEADGKIYAFKGVLDGFISISPTAGFPIAHSDLDTLNLRTGQTHKIVGLDPNVSVIFGAAPVRNPHY